MRAVVMCGGLGTRMAPYTDVVPKCLLPIGDRPILAIVLDQLARGGVERVDLCTGHLGGLVRAYVREAADELPELDLHLHREPEALGTAGALRDLPGVDAPLLVLNGDVLAGLDVPALFRDHVEAGAAMTVVSRRERIGFASGVLELDGDRVRAYVEKPQFERSVSLGVYVVAPAALAHLPPGRVDVPEFVETLLAAGEVVRAQPLAGVWFDIGTPADHARAREAFATDPAAFLLPAPAPS